MHCTQEGTELVIMKNDNDKDDKIRKKNQEVRKEIEDRRRE
jgi:hypothetical protein